MNGHNRYLHLEVYNVFSKNQVKPREITTKDSVQSDFQSQMGHGDDEAHFSLNGKD